MFHTQAPIHDSGEMLTAYIGIEGSFKIRDWLISEIDSEADVLHLNGVPTMVSRQAPAYEIWNAMWYRTTVAMQRSRRMTIQEYQRDYRNLSRAHIINGLYIQVKSKLPYEMLGFQQDGVPKFPCHN